MAVQTVEATVEDQTHEDRVGLPQRRDERIWFNVAFAKKHPYCLSCIVAHEMTHYLERNHDDRFTSVIDEHTPDWRSRRDLLNDSPLSHEDWGHV